MSLDVKKFPLFSVITITKDHYAGLKQTYQSLQEQKFSDYEWIVIDGGSTDDTIPFLKEHRSQTRQAPFPFKFTSGEDNGIYDAMNIGTSMARGRYLIFMNAGDCFTKPSILSLIAQETKNKPEFIYGDSLEGITQDDAPDYKAAKPSTTIASGMFTHHQAMIYNRLRLRSLKLRYSLKYKIASDYDFTARFLDGLEADKIVYIPKPLCVFEPGGLSQQNAATGRKEQFLIREQLNIVPQPLNVLIFIKQWISWNIRRFSPSLYRFLRRQ